MTEYELVFYPIKAYMDGTGTGYFQEKFSFTCPGSRCLLQIDKATLGIRKFFDDIVRKKEGLRDYLAQVTSLLSHPFSAWGTN